MVARHDRSTAARVVTMPPSPPAWHPLAGLIQQPLWGHDRVRQAATSAVGVVIRVGPDETVDPVVTRGVQ